MIWRVWQEAGTGLRELRYEWTYRDLLHANAVLDMRQAANIAADALAESEAPKPGKN